MNNVKLMTQERVVKPLPVAAYEVWMKGKDIVFVIDFFDGLERVMFPGTFPFGLIG